MSTAVQVFLELGINNVPLASIAKQNEEIFIPNFSEPVEFSSNPESLNILQKIRDEAHRFAISFQKQQRKASISKSVFHSIEGMGDKRVKMLLKQYKDIKMISGLKPQMIKKDLGISVKIAKEIISIAKSQN